MASIVTDLLCSTVGLLLNEARDKMADKLKDRDTTDAMIREMVVRELKDVKTKLDGLSRKDLLTSYNFLQEGVNLLKAFLDKSEEKQKAVLSKTPGDAGFGETSAKPSDTESGILTETLALYQAMQKVKISSDEDLIESAKKRFEDARRKATEAYNIETLSIQDRIFAAKLRITSELLECIEQPGTAIISCLTFLEQLHGLSAIREIFRVYIGGGVRSMVSKAERVENVKSVMLINYVLFQFASEFSSKYFTAIAWPTIELVDHSFHPILSWMKVSRKRSWDREFTQPPNEVSLADEIHHISCVVNSRGEIIARVGGENIHLASRTGRVKIVKLNYPTYGKVIGRYITGLAVDSNNNIYVLTYLGTYMESSVVESHVLCVFDESYNIKQNCTLHFLDATLHSYADVAVNKNNDIIINMKLDPHVYVCDNAGKLKHKFERETCCVYMLTISDKNEIIFTSDNHNTVHRYTEKGDLESTIRFPESHEIRGVAFHHAICKFLVLTCVIKKRCSYFLRCYSETGELEHSIFLCKGLDRERPYIKSHPSGPVVVVWGSKITFI